MLNNDAFFSVQAVHMCIFPLYSTQLCVHKVNYVRDDKVIAHLSMNIAYHIRFNFRGVKLLQFASFHSFRVSTFTAAESQAGEIKPCVSFCVKFS